VDAAAQAPLSTLGDMLGDALYATMVFFLAGVIFPRWTVFKRAAVALIFAFCIEFTQLYHRPWIDEIRSTSLARRSWATASRGRI
jgi:hypothetical protein